jgi:hypothetical protein
LKFPTHGDIFVLFLLVGHGMTQLEHFSTDLLSVEIHHFNDSGRFFMLLDMKCMLIAETCLHCERGLQKKEKRFLPGIEPVSSVVDVSIPHHQTVTHWMLNELNEKKKKKKLQEIQKPVVFVAITKMSL